MSEHYPIVTERDIEIRNECLAKGSQVIAAYREEIESRLLRAAPEPSGDEPNPEFHLEDALKTIKYSDSVANIKLYAVGAIEAAIKDIGHLRALLSRPTPGEAGLREALKARDYDEGCNDCRKQWGMPLIESSSRCSFHAYHYTKSLEVALKSQIEITNDVRTQAEEAQKEVVRLQKMLGGKDK